MAMPRGRDVPTVGCTTWEARHYEKIYLWCSVDSIDFSGMENYSKSISELESHVGTEAARRQYLFQIRWPNGFGCSHFLESADAICRFVKMEIGKMAEAHRSR